jgi:cobalt/nickel transport system ATP-binding protein
LIRARRTLINLLRELPITTHDMRLVQVLFPHTIVMDEGQVVADGLTMEILENEELLTAHELEKPLITSSLSERVGNLREMESQTA